MIIDRLTKSAHFIQVRIDYFMDRLAELYVDEIVIMHGVPLSIVQTETQDLRPDFGRNYSQAWVLG